MMQLATQTLARLIRAAGDPAHGDEGVFEAPRIMRIPGTVNRKPDADPTTPAWILDPWTPGIRTPWAIVEKIAARSRPKLRVIPGGRKTASQTGTAVFHSVHLDEVAAAVAVESGSETVALRTRTKKT
jgi:hypothetical protein